jgi:hypothetical protein
MKPFDISASLPSRSFCRKNNPDLRGIVIPGNTNVFSGLVYAEIFRGPDFLFLQATMEPLDVASRMMKGRAAVGDAELH